MSALVLAFAGSAAPAQTAEPAASEGLGDIVVTASRREERAIDVPVAVTSIGGEKLAVFARNIADKIRSVSAIDFNNLTGMVNEPRIIGVSLSKKF
ncbi:hypothetical protein CLG96_08770 [Sphingomonas oleivorans]|uniref:TonB-dependent receptor n=1 Tax=Sphingomonas oleivorans TaxID=1735121 RepID=A0A2T5FYA6_9SPHN|nr:hypothetical protein CLG96_08770 [Sphingomonas oleivorans]